jgi:hypothetical protein
MKPFEEYPIIMIRSSIVAAVVLVIAMVFGCNSVPTGLPTPLPDRANRMHHGYLYYIDGAGGGTAKKNWAGGVREGLMAAGYPGAGEMYSWETGDGLLKDQVASVDYKRSRAKGLATEIQNYAMHYPEAPVHILSFSAGAPEAIYALEALPESVQVDNVVMLGASISEDYDLTEALKHVRNKLYLYTSTKDEMLGFLMKFSGTADRKFHDPGAGIKGFALPKGATAETRQAYADKIIAIEWTKALEQDGDAGHHFDNVKMEFIRDHVAPLLMGKPVPGVPGVPGISRTSALSAGRPVRNPAHEPDIM